MGVFEVKIRLRNWQNRFLPARKRGKEVVCSAIVDTGAVELALPAEIVERLKLEQTGTTTVHTADGARHQYRMMGIVEVEVQGRSCRAEAIELPRGSRPLLGAVPLELMDWHVSPSGKKLEPNPLSPKEPLLPLC